MAFRRMQVIMTENRCYKSGKRITPRGIVVHSTGTNAPDLKRWVQPDPDGTIGVNEYGNHWNQAKGSKCVHGFLGRLDDGSLAFVQTLPWDYRCWGCGKGKSGSYNDSHIQFEVCEDGLKNPGYYNACFEAAAQVCAELCKMYGIRTRNIVGHYEAAASGYASTHIDPKHWMDEHGDSMDAFRARVADLIGEDDMARPTWDEERRDTVREGARSAHVAELQGILAALGYLEGKVDGIFGSKTKRAVMDFQASKGLLIDGVAGPSTWKAALKDIAALEGDIDRPDSPVTTSGWDAMTDHERIEDLHKRLMAVEGR